MLRAIFFLFACSAEDLSPYFYFFTLVSLFLHTNFILFVFSVFLFSYRLHLQLRL
jgi:hypothetical protein